RDVLDDPSLDEDRVASHVEPVATKPLNDGIDIDPAGNVYLTDVEHGGIARIDPAGTVTTITNSPDVLWPDGVVVAPDGRILLTDSAIPAYIDQLARPPAKARLDAAAPYRIYRFRPPA
ncbi:MAG: hypothetical protein ACRCYQ_16290, partial [Nocardioides sp.]